MLIRRTSLISDPPMASIKVKKTSAITLLALMLLVAGHFVEAQPTYSPMEAFFTVYADGFVAVDYTTEVDPTKARVNITLFGSLYQDLIVEDQDGLLLEYSPIEGGLMVDTLGSTVVLISYVTPDLTGKTGQTWVFSYSTSVNSSILMPEDATIKELNVTPLAMGSLDGKPLLILPAGDVEVTYTFAIVDMREHALIIIKDAEQTINEVKTRGIVVTEAEDLLQKAYDSFNSELYVEAEQHAEKAKASAQSSETAASLAEDAISDAEAAVTAARDEGRTQGLDAAENLLQDALDAYETGDYSGAETLAEQAITSAADAKAEETEEETPRRPYTWIAGGAAALAMAFAALFILKRRKPAVERAGEEVDLEELFETHPYLRLDDKEVLSFLLDSGGEAFASEIRERFNIPRTSAWRMIRRLQREGLVEVKEIGGQSQVKITERYR